jgi:hypothetical protein
MHREKLQRPELGWVKVNCDVAFTENTLSGAWGAIARKHDELVLFSARDVIPHY